MKSLKSLTFLAAALGALALTSSAEAAVRVRVGVRVTRPVVVRSARVVINPPGPGYVVVEGRRVLRPWAAAVWVPGHYSRHGVWISGHWR